MQLDQYQRVVGDIQCSLVRLLFLSLSHMG